MSEILKKDLNPNLLIHSAGPKDGVFVVFMDRISAEECVSAL